MTLMRRTVRTDDDVMLDVCDTGGDGVPLVLLHGWMQSQELFRHQLADGAERRVVSVDMRGHGLSEKPEHGYRISRLAADLRDVLASLEIGSADLLGVSMGVSVIWSYLELFGDELVRSLILVDQQAALVAQPWMSAQEAADAGSILPADGLAALAAAIAADDGENAVRAYIRSMFTGAVDADLWELVTAEALRTPRRVGAALLVDHGFQDWRDRLPLITVPTLVIGCEGSHVPVLSQRYVAARIPGAEVHVFPRAVADSHFPFLENPIAFNERVGRFLDDR